MITLSLGSKPFNSTILILSLKIGLILFLSLKEKIIKHFDKSKSIPEKYLSLKELFWLLSVKWINNEITSFPNLFSSVILSN